MATHIYRYNWLMINISRVNSSIDPALPASISNAWLVPQLDISADDSTKADLDYIMQTLGWSFASTDPVGSGVTALSQQTITQSATIGGTPSPAITITGGAHTGLANVESNDINWNLARAVQFTGGAFTIPTQRAALIQAPTYAAVLPGLNIKTAATLAISGAPVAGANTSITSALALWVQSGVSSFAGNVGIGTTTPGNTLDVAGAAHATSFPTSSDSRFKTKVREIQGALEKIKRLRGVTFDWKSNYKKSGRGDETRQIGLVAQEVEEHFPELVRQWQFDDEMKDARSVDYGRLTAVLVQAVKELISTVEKQGKLIDRLAAA